MFRRIVNTDLGKEADMRRTTEIPEIGTCDVLCTFKQVPAHSARQAQLAKKSAAYKLAGKFWALRCTGLIQRRQTFGVCRKVSQVQFRLLTEI